MNIINKTKEEIHIEYIENIKFLISSSVGEIVVSPNFNECLPDKRYHYTYSDTSKIYAYENDNGEIVVDYYCHESNKKRLVDADQLIRRMKERDEDNGGEPLNATDRGYHLAVTHLIKEIDDLLKEK